MESEGPTWGLCHQYLPGTPSISDIGSTKNQMLFIGRPEHRLQILEVNFSSVYPLASILWGLDPWVIDLGRVWTETSKTEHDRHFSSSEWALVDGLI